jgi:hypothetical protein
MTSLKANEIPKLITDRLGLVLFDDICELLHYDKSKCGEVLKTLIVKSLIELARTYPVQMKNKIIINRRLYTFVDNFQSYLDGAISNENNIVLKPIAIYFLKSGAMALNSQWWDYQPNSGQLSLQFGGGNMYVEYAANYPYNLILAPGGRFTEDSAIYYIGGHNQEVFLDFLCYYVIRQVKLIQGSIQLGTQIQFLPMLESLSSEFEQLVQTHKDQRSDILRMWRK